ncbi:RNA methyltransferase [Candidatus Hepatincola sp. Pdp]
MIINKDFIIQSIDKDLDGIIKINGQTIKVPFSNLADVVHITSLNTKNKIPIANIQPIKASTDRQLPICKYYGRCGGCKGQHFQTKDYLNYKVQNIKNIFSFYKFPFPEFINMEIFHHMESPKGRRRIVLGVMKNKIGFKEYHSHNIIPIDFCPIATDTINTVIALLQKYISNQNAILQINEIIISDIKGEINLHLKSSTKAELTQLQVLQPLFNSEVIQQIFWEYKKELTPIIIKKELQLVYGNYTVPFISGGFMQAEEFGEKTLIKLISHALQDQTKVLDLFCGFGAYALSLAGKLKVHGVDYNAYPLKILGQQPNVTTEVRNLFANPYCEKELQQFSAVIINPPRIGAKAQVNEIASVKGSKVKDIIMVYCDVSSAVRDLKILKQSQVNNFQIMRMAMIEQFIFSKHVELFIHLQKS